LLKGNGTLVTDGDQIWLVDEGNPGMASAGMGDVLTGIIAGLLAQGMALLPAAACGAWLHAKAGDRAAACGGEAGLVATDLLPHLRALRG
jgi:NAD(P)H-hydrate epimerase